MSNLIVHGGKPLRGRITPSANKNAVLPVLCATLLTSEPLRLHRVPDITDVRKILDIFRMLGSEVRMDHATDTLELHHRATRFDAATHRLPEEMRSSIMLVPPLLARFGVARLEELGLELRPGMTPAAVDAFVAAESDKWQGVMRAAGIRAD